MAIVNFKVPPTTELNRFYNENRCRSINYIKAKFSSLSDDDIEDIYQEASIALFENIQKGKLTELTTSLFSYFMCICNNLAMKSMRHKFDTTSIDENRNGEGDDNLNEFDDEPLVQERKMDELSALLDDSDSVQSHHEHIDDVEEKVREGVKNMPEPCNKILWSMYWDNFSHQAIATLYGYSSANYCKVTASRCRDKFSKFLKSNNILL